MAKGKGKHSDSEYVELMDATVRAIVQRIAAAGLHGLDPFGMVAVMHAATEEVVAGVLAGFDLKARMLSEADDHLREVQLRDACRDLATMAHQHLLTLIDQWEARRAQMQAEAGADAGASAGASVHRARALTPDELHRMFRGASTDAGRA